MTRIMLGTAQDQVNCDLYDKMMGGNNGIPSVYYSAQISSLLQIVDAWGK